jgi:hypothetical protein
MSPYSYSDTAAAAVAVVDSTGRRGDDGEEPGAAAAAAAAAVVAAVSLVGPSLPPISPRELALPLLLVRARVLRFWPFRSRRSIKASCV